MQLPPSPSGRRPAAVAAVFVIAVLGTGIAPATAAPTPTPTGTASLAPSQAPTGHVTARPTPTVTPTRRVVAPRVTPPARVIAPAPRVVAPTRPAPVRPVPARPAPVVVTTTPAPVAPAPIAPSMPATPTPTAPTTSVPPSDPPDSPENECPGCRLISAPAPLVQQVCGPDNDIVRTQRTRGVEWHVGRWRDGFLTVLAVAEPGTVFPQGVDNIWTFHDDDGGSCPLPGAHVPQTPVAVPTTTRRVPVDTSKQQAEALEAGLVSVQRFRDPFRDTLAAIAAMGVVTMAGLWGLARRQERMLVGAGDEGVGASGLLVPTSTDYPGVVLPMATRVTPVEPMLAVADRSTPSATTPSSGPGALSLPIADEEVVMAEDLALTEDDLTLDESDPILDEDDVVLAQSGLAATDAFALDEAVVEELSLDGDQITLDDTSVLDEIVLDESLLHDLDGSADAVDPVPDVSPTDLPSLVGLPVAAGLPTASADPAPVDAAPVAPAGAPVATDLPPVTADEPEIRPTTPEPRPVDLRPALVGVAAVALLGVGIAVGRRCAR